MKKIVTVLFIVLLSSLAACSSSYSSKNLKPSSSVGSAQSGDAELNTIQVSQYQTGSTKTQPELTNYYTEKEHLSVLVEWLKKAGNPIDLPVGKKITKIQTVSFFYENNEKKTIKSNGYMLVTLEDGNRYSKQIQPPNSIPDIYPYKESDNEDIITQVGTNVWSQMGDAYNLL